MSGDRAARPRRAASTGTRDSLVVLLAVGAGAADVTAFLALGQVFSTVITGNLVLLGLAAATGSAAKALHSGLALAGYSAGVLIGAPVAARGGGRRVWPRPVTAALCLELCLLVAFAAAWESVREYHSGRIALLVLLAAAMGVQSAAVRRLGNMSATYLTGTLTGVLASLVTRSSSDGRSRDVGVIVAVVAGAAAGAAAIRAAPAWLPALSLLPVCAVLVAAALLEWDPAEAAAG